MSRSSLSRRDFIRLSCCSAAAGAALATGVGRFGLVNAYAQGPTYKALICIFLFGGNDGNNTVIPFDTAGYSAYLAARGDSVANPATALGLPQGSLLPINVKTLNNQPYSAYALHPLMPGLQSLFNSGKAAVVANVGTLIKPTSQFQYTHGQVQVPSALFSHSDQQNQWQTAAPNSKGSSGWAGRTADKTQGLNAGVNFPMIVSLAGANIFATGIATRPAAVNPGQTSAFNNLDATRNTAMQNLLTLDSGVSLVQAASNITGFAFSDSNALATALTHKMAFNTQFPNTSIGGQLLQVAQIIQVRSFLSSNPINRQIFFCSMGGFDTHNHQLPDQGTLLTQLSAGMSAFYNATVEMGVDSQVTAFTLSDFGRTLQPSSGAGSDHAWGSHHIVVGGAVHGGDMYGSYPSLVLGGPNDTNTGNSARGRWIPSTPADQYAATLASWFGVSDSDLTSYVFPDLVNFQPTIKLGFMG
jgi:uncharacterized protein (DUF1501 family)